MQSRSVFRGPHGDDGLSQRAPRSLVRPRLGPAPSIVGPQPHARRIITDVQWMTSIFKPGALLLSLVLLVLSLAVPSAEGKSSAPAPALPIVGFNDNFNSYELAEPTHGGGSLLPNFPGSSVISGLIPLGPSDDAPPLATTPKRAALIRRASEGGAQVIRYVVPWVRVERLEGTYDWTTEDATYELALQAGLKPVIVLVTAPCWAHPSVPCGPHQVVRPDPNYVDEFGDFARAAVERYPEAAGFEVWNESNLPAFWGGKPSVRSYQTLLEEVWNRTRDVEPRPTIVYNGLTPRQGWKRYLRTSYEQLGAGAFADVTALHPYVGRHGSKRVRGQLQFARRTLKAAQAPNRIWFTEFGWSTNPKATAAVGEQGQAKRTVATLELARKAHVAVAVIHRLQDIEHPTSAWESGLGALRLDGSPKPLFCALARPSSDPLTPGC
jgi:hypothetical protein